MKELLENWKDFLEEEKPCCPECSPDEDLEEGDDRCTRIAKRKYDVWPSAYASGAVVKCRDGKIWKDLKEEEVEEDLRKWFNRKGEKGSTGGWVDCNAPDGDGGYKQCAQGDRKKKPACRPTPSACKDPGKGTKWGKKSEAVALSEEQLEEIVGHIVDSLEEDFDFILDEAGKCTKVTKKASSDRKGKKWMKCVKSDSGGYKRIHWGQKGVRVTGKSGNTKRKKSFKARHNCSKAKSNTPQGQACKDWAE
tara:strand:+ start:2686 stop:3435 length:750 start_codon:yes stop_codon:yes gene_type:complete